MKQKCNFFYLFFVSILIASSCNLNIDTHNNSSFNAIKLLPGASFTEGELKTGESLWYYFDVVKTKKYQVYASDSFLLGSEYTASTTQTYYLSDSVTQVTAKGSNPAVFENIDEPKIYIKVQGFTINSEGSFGLRITEELLF